MRSIIKDLLLLPIMLVGVAAIPVGLATIPLWCHICVKETVK